MKRSLPFSTHFTSLYSAIFHNDAMDFFNYFWRSRFNWTSWAHLIFRWHPATFEFINPKVNGLHRNVPVNFIHLDFDLRNCTLLQIKIFYHCPEFLFLYFTTTADMITSNVYQTKTNHRFWLKIGMASPKECFFLAVYYKIHCGTIFRKFTLLIERPTYLTECSSFYIFFSLRLCITIDLVSTFLLLHFSFLFLSLFPFRVISEALSLKILIPPGWHRRSSRVKYHGSSNAASRNDRVRCK